MGLTPTPDSESNFALFSYSLAGLSEVTRWHQGRFTAGISMVQMAELIDLFPPSSASERQLMKKLQLLRFRPKMIDGTPQSVNGTLKYMFASRRQR